MMSIWTALGWVALASVAYILSWVLNVRRLRASARPTETFRVTVASDEPSHEYTLRPLGADSFGLPVRLERIECSQKMSDQVRRVTLSVVHINLTIHFDEILEELAERGLRPATVEENVALLSHIRGQGRRMCAVALGSLSPKRPFERRLATCIVADGQCEELRSVGRRVFGSQYQFVAAPLEAA